MEMTLKNSQERPKLLALVKQKCPATQTDPDTCLMLAVQNDQPGAFEELVECYQTRIKVFLFHQFGDVNDAEDVAQEVFLRVFQARKRYRVEAKFSTWFFTIAANVAINFRRRKQRRRIVNIDRNAGDSHGTDALSQLPSDSCEQPLRRVLHKESANIVREALCSLNERQRLVLLLCGFEKLPYADAAEAMGLTAKAVKSMLSRARMNLRLALRGYWQQNSRY
jgi:RNA polymerase sigma-70 factor (ECF subfamily)